MNFPFLTKDIMGEVGVTSVILFPFLLLCLSAIQEAAVLTPPEKIGCFHRSEFSVKDIYIHRQPQLGSLLLPTSTGGR